MCFCVFFWSKAVFFGFNCTPVQVQYAYTSPRYVYCTPETRQELDLGLLSFRAARWSPCDAGQRRQTLQFCAALQEAKRDVEAGCGLRPVTVLRASSPAELTVPRRVSMLVQQRLPRRPPVVELRIEVD